jgi:hypothetical protein
MMAKGVKATVSGDREIIANLRRAQRSVGGRFLDNTLSESLKPMKERTEANARPLRDYAGKYPGFPPPLTPRKGGHLDQGVKIARQEVNGMFGRVYWVAFAKRARKIAHLVEFGTAPHFQPNFGGGFNHPGAAPHPFFRPAFEATKDQVAKEVGVRTWMQIRGSLIGAFK